MESTSRFKIVASALAATGILHLILAPEYLEEQTYIGVLFIVGGLTAIVLAYLAWTRADTSAVALGAAIALGMGVGFVLSRTTGLPGFHEGEWEFSGVLSLVLEGITVMGAAQILSARGGATQLARG